MGRSITRLVITLLLVTPILAYALSARDTAIQDRIQPVGQVYTDGQQPAPIAAAGAGGVMSPEDRYKSVCHVCHDAGIAGAPKFGDKAAWAARTTAGMNVVYDRALKGYKGMPPKGTCMTCSDDDIKAVVDYMVAKAK